MANISQQIREEVRRRARACCEYCLSQERYSSASFSIEHIYPLSRGGQNDLDNLAYACLGCNGFKYNKLKCFDPVSNKEVRLYNPRIDAWGEHFVWSHDKIEIHGITAPGRATIACLQLNRPHVMNLRRLLAAAGEHPPTA